MSDKTNSEIISFLRGDAALDGKWFGDAEGGALFWWRKYLNQLESSQQTAELEAEVKRTKDELKRIESLCDESNETVNQIWRIANEALNK